MVILVLMFCSFKNCKLRKFEYPKYRLVYMGLRVSGLGFGGREYIIVISFPRFRVLRVMQDLLYPP